MKTSIKFLITATLISLPILPGLKSTPKQVNKENIPFLKESAAKRSLSLRDLVSHLKMMNLAQAQSSLPASSTNNLRDSIGLAIGYSDNTAYGELACNGSIPAANTDCTNAPPYNGIVGRLTDIINTLPTIGESVGITSCEAVPASGSATGTDSNNNSVTIHFKTPTHSVPTPWIGGGTTFQKRVEFQETLLGDSTKIAYEFNCGDSPAAYVAINMDMGTIDTHPYTRRIAVYTGPVTTAKNGIEVYMAEYSTDVRLRSADAVRIEYTPASNEYNLWGIMNTNINGGQLVTRSVVHGNYVTSKATVLYNGYYIDGLAGNDGAIDITTTNGAGAFATSVDLTNGTGSVPDHDFATDLSGSLSTPSVGVQVYKKGCIDFSSPTTAPADTSNCAGLALATTAIAPYADATGDFSIHWTLATMPTKLEVLP